MDEQPAEFEYIVVGSGAGGGVVAARLAEAGHTVLLLEAGGDYKHLQGGGPAGPPGANRLPQDYEVPTFHPMASENEALKWDFFVRHYADTAQQKRDEKYYETYDGKPVDGVLYPRAGTLGGCTAHNAMIMIYPHNADWDHIADITRDESWRAKHMRRYFERMENCRHRWPYELLYRLTGWNWTRHGFSGWLSTEKAIPKAALEDRGLVDIIKKSVWTAFWELANGWERLTWVFQGQGDPNDWRLVRKNATGIRYTPLSTHRHVRNGTREFLLDVARRHPDRLKIELEALATEVLFDDLNRAIGVAYLKGAKLYRASFNPAEAAGTPQKAFASREVVLAGGAFNTPQLLMLSGIGPAEELEALGIKTRVNLPGVGRNLQDRYEVGVVNRLEQDWSVLKGATFTPADPQFKQWSRWGRGVYTTNGAALAIITRSDQDRPLPDLFVFALLGKFKGYFPGYSKLIAEVHNVLTWCILKAHTSNHGGTVKLRTTDPLDPPQIDFHYFKEGTDTEGLDLAAVVEGIKFVRSLTAPIRDMIAEEELPGAANQTDAELAQFVQDNAWGHHASCTCQIGPASNPLAVLDSNFRVYGTSNLRVADASVFPKIPGFFIVTSVYMIGEKASDAILASAGQANVPDSVYGQGFWNRVRRAVGLAAIGTGVALHALKPAGAALLGIAGALAVLLIAIIAASWFIFEPPGKADLDEEAGTIRSITDVMTSKVEQQYKGQTYLRATDPTGNACVKANVTISPHLSPRLNVGFLEGKPGGDKTYKAWIRFSNAADRPTSDTQADFRGMAVKLFGVSGERLPYPGDEADTQDLLFAGHDAWFAGDPQQLRDYFAACVNGGGSCDATGNPYVAWHMITHPRGAYNLLTGRQTYPSIEDVRWFSVTPYNLGDPAKVAEPQIVKYGAFPCRRQASYNAPGDTPYYLVQRLQNLLDPANNNHLCLQLQVQVRNDPDSQPIENALVAWDDSVATWQKVARIDIYPQTFTSTAQQEFCERLTFNPWNGLKAHMPIGGLNRARRDVMQAMQDVRLKANGMKRFGPHELTGDETF